MQFGSAGMQISLDTISTRIATPSRRLVQKGNTGRSAGMWDSIGTNSNRMATQSMRLVQKGDIGRSAGM